MVEKSPKNSGYLLPKMQNTLKIHMKTPKFGNFAKIKQFKAFYMQNTPKTWDIQCDFSEKSGNSQKLSVQLTSNLTVLVENSKKIGIFSKTGKNFQILMSANLYLVQ